MTNSDHRFNIVVVRNVYLVPMILLCSTLIASSSIAFSGCGNQPPVSKPGGERVKLINNEVARAHPWKEVFAFLDSDSMDKETYSSERGTASIAEIVHNRAEYQAYKTAFVVVDFEDGKTHYLNAFATVDYGTVFADCTGYGPFDLRPPRGIEVWWVDEMKTIYFPVMSNSWDKVAYLKEGQRMVFVTAHADLEGFTYEWYVKEKGSATEAYESLSDVVLGELDEYNKSASSGKGNSYSYSMWLGVFALVDMWKKYMQPFYWSESTSAVRSIKLYW